MPITLENEQIDIIKNMIVEGRSYPQIARELGVSLDTVKRRAKSFGLQRLNREKVPQSELRAFLRTIQEAFGDLEQVGHLEADDRAQNDKIITYLRSLIDKAYYIDKAFVNVTGVPVKPDLTPAFKVRPPKMTKHEHVLGGAS